MSSSINEYFRQLYTDTNGTKMANLEDLKELEKSYLEKLEEIEEEMDNDHLFHVHYAKNYIKSFEKCKELKDKLESLQDRIKEQEGEKK